MKKILNFQIKMYDYLFVKLLIIKKLVPVTINYEKVLEGETFPFELLGETKVKESLLRMIYSIGALNKNFGRIFVEFCEPINLKYFFKTNLN